MTAPIKQLGPHSPFWGCIYCEASQLGCDDFKHEVGCPAPWSNKPTTKLLAEIGVGHEPSPHSRHRRLSAANGRTIDLMDCFEANAFFIRAQCAA